MPVGPTLVDDRVRLVTTGVDDPAVDEEAEAEEDDEDDDDEEDDDGADDDVAAWTGGSEWDADRVVICAGFVFTTGWVDDEAPTTFVFAVVVEVDDDDAWVEVDSVFDCCGEKLLLLSDVFEFSWLKSSSFES